MCIHTCRGTLYDITLHHISALWINFVLETRYRHLEACMHRQVYIDHICAHQMTYRHIVFFIQRTWDGKCKREGPGKVSETLYKQIESPTLLYMWFFPPPETSLAFLLPELYSRRSQQRRSSSESWTVWGRGKWNRQDSSAKEKAESQKPEKEKNAGGHNQSMGDQSRRRKNEEGTLLSKMSSKS